MIYQFLLIAHIAVLGYWLGAELVINSTYRYVCYADEMPVAERSRLMSHVMRVDQHVRYALILQVSLGTALAALLGYFPGGQSLLIGAGIAGVIWLMFVEVLHRLREHRIEKSLAKIDRVSRYGLVALCFGIGLGIVGGGYVGNSWHTPDWLRWKLIFFAGVILCGVAIRLVLIRQFRVWGTMQREGPGSELNSAIRKTYVQATSVLALLWLFIAMIVVVSASKPL